MTSNEQEMAAVKNIDLNVPKAINVNHKCFVVVVFTCCPLYRQKSPLHENKSIS